MKNEASVGASAGVWQLPQSAQDILAHQDSRSPAGVFATTMAYVVQFYPLWFTYHQSLLSSSNRLAGPDRISPIYHFVVAINDDTIYASSFLDLTVEPVILRIPTTVVTYSILTLDPYGEIFQTELQPQTTGVCGLTGPGFAGTLPEGITPIAMPLNFSTLIFRADKFSSTGENQIEEATTFRASLKMQPLSEYSTNPTGGATKIFPEIVFVVPFKTTADELIAHAPVTFLRQLQRAVAAPNTPTFSPFERDLSDRFDRLFDNGGMPRSEFGAGAQTAHDLILDRYLTHTGPTNWIHFTNIGTWGGHVIERAAITEFIQFGNGISTAAYYHAFSNGTGRPLDGRNLRGYVLTFPAGQIPQAKRFWSLTAYTPEAIELVHNAADKYLVASYTPGLQHNADGSLSIYMAVLPPAGVPTANWLPIPLRLFNVILRVYGPEGDVADNTYVPPGIQNR
jgi:hypothetical protein